MTKLKNLFYLLAFGGTLLAIKFLLIDKIFPQFPNDAGIWFTSGLLLVILGVFVTEKYFTRSLDVLVNVITLIVVLLTLDKPELFRLWDAVFFYCIAVGILALISFVLYDEQKDQNLSSQKIADMSGTVARFLGSSRLLFSIVFILSIFNYFVFSIEKSQLITKEQVAVLVLIIFWGAVLLVEPIDRRFIQPLFDRATRKNRDKLVGKVVRRISPNIIVAEQLPNISTPSAGTLMALNRLRPTNGDHGRALMYLYSQDTENSRHAFFFALDSSPDEVSEDIYVHSIEVDAQRAIAARFPDNEIIRNRSNLVGFVDSGSDIDILKIKMIEGVDNEKRIKEGDLVSVSFYGSPTKYQIINVQTASEAVQGTNKQGGKIITAQQIGAWQTDKQKFEDMGWVPEINAPVFIESAGEEVELIDKNCYRVGVVPKSSYPIYINLEECVTHHIAIIGKTGTGKSRMSAKIIEKMAQIGYQIIIFELDRKHAQSLTRYIDSSLVEEQASDAFDLSKTTKPIVSINLQVDAKAKGTTGTVNLSDIAAGLIEKVIQYQIKDETKKICIAMEEAYDFIPESTFGSQAFGQPTVSRISQMVLKCRKHNIGLLVITQRTALVTKTILYQCHTIIALQSFDETSKNFMGAYINQRYLDSMSILPRFRAIVVGKGSSCDKPVIVDFFDPKLATPNATARAAATIP
ncbi:MAG: DUF87 domain-containing protein [Rhodospirillaceae bacterium]|nr:MAG: DUF87 domain-containing protein [Rhodospirillaceae bacterium]